MRLPLFVVLFMLPLALVAADSHEIDPRKYFGTYEFEDGVRVSGGRFDEAGQQMLLYMDTAAARRGAPLVREKGAFVPAFGLPGPARVTFSAQGDRMHWTLPAGETLLARRVMQPLFRDVAFSNGDVSLRGTLYLPTDGKAALPAVVLAHGSGPVSRYAGTWTTFFLEQGMAVLAFDKRGVGESGGDWKTATYLDLATDLDAAVAWLATQPEIDVSRIGVHTSSQSGWYGPRTALMNESIAFLIQRAAPAVTIDIGTAHELREEWRSEGLPGDVIQAGVAFWLELHELAKQQASRDAVNERLHEARGEPWFKQAFGDWSEITQGWLHRHAENLQLDPASDSARLDIPVLWFLAELDENVPYVSSKKALDSARERNPDLRVITVGNAAHSFLVEAAGGVRYTDEYWPVMKEWLRQNDIVR